MSPVLPIALVALLANLVPYSAAAQQLDVSQLRGAADIPPVESRALEFSEGVSSLDFRISGSMLFHFDVSDPTARYDVSLASPEPTSLVIEAMRLELNDAGQPTDRDVLATQTTSSLDDRPAALLSAVYRSGRVYLGVAALRPVSATLTVRRVAPAAVVTDPTSRVREAPDADNDISGIWKGDDICLRPERLKGGEPTDLSLLHPLGEGAELRIYDDQERSLLRRAGPGELVVRNLQQPGLIACVELSGRADPELGWRLLAEASDYPDGPAEPDDRREAVPTQLTAGAVVAAALDVHDFDRYLLPEKGADAYRVSVRAAARLEACVLSPSGKKQECYRGRTLTLGPVAPGSGVVIEHVTDRSLRYELRAEAAVFDSKRMVHEPNSRLGDQPLLGSDVRVEGVLGPRGDEDVVGFDAGAKAQLWRVVVLGDSVDQLYVYNDRGNVAEVKRRGNARRLTTPDFYLDPGGAYLRISGEPGPYKLVIKPLGPPRPDSEREPNEYLPRRIAVGQEITGTLHDGDRDRFSFFLDRQSPVAALVDAPAGARYRMEVTTAGAASAPALYRATIEGNNWRQDAVLPAGEHVLELQPLQPSPAEYRLGLSFRNPFVTAGTATLQVEEAPQVQAYSLFRQRLTLALSSPGAAEIQGLELHSWFAIADVTARLAGEATTPVLQIDLPSDLPEGPLQGFIALRDSEGRVLASGGLTFDARAAAAPVNRYPDAPAPESMIGGINVALSALGARWLPSGPNDIDPETGDYIRGNPSRAENLLSIIDGFLVQGLGASRHEAFLSRDGQPPLAPILDLPGERPIALAGIGIDTRMLNSLGPARFAIDLSTDGSNWQEVLVAEHSVWGRTVYHPFPAGVLPATQLRLRILEKQGAERAPVAISGLEAIAAPGASGLSGLNIADERLGALVSGWRDMRGSTHFQISPQSLELERLDSDGSATTDFNLAVSFRNQMPAQVGGVEFVYPPNVDEADYPWAGEAIVSISPNGPAGPWREIARVTLPTTPEAGARVAHALPEYVTGRAVKVDYTQIPDGYFMVPAQLRVLERAEDGEYRSVLGLWGEYASTRFDANAGTETSAAPGNNNCFDITADGARHAGLVQFAEREETWRIRPEPGDTLIRLSVQGSPGFEPGVAATDSRGAEVPPLAVLRRDFAEGTVYEFPLTQGDYLDVTVTEDARSTVFLFDQSPSVARYIPVIRRAVVDYAESMEAGRDAVQFKALGGDWARDEWYTDPENLRRALAVYGGGDRSNAESALLDAAKLLRDRRGSRAVVVITDGDGGAEAALPHALAAAKARVFVIKISSGGGSFSDASTSQPLVASWAGQTGGEVAPVLKSSDVAEGYARASARLLGPKPYRLAATSDYRPLDPGFVRVEHEDDGAGPVADGRLIIFDASGSMLKRLESGRRIGVARQVISDFVAELGRADGSAALGLRTFGGPPDSCETQLVRAPERQPVVDVQEAIGNIRPQNNARTAIAAAVEAAAQDLAGESDGYSVLLVTDGEETCGGDPLAAVTALRADGAGPRVDVVAFALDPEVDRRPFEQWAEAGDGVFFDAATGEELARALATTRRIRFDILDGGKPLASGVAGGGPVAVPPGNYQIRFDGIPELLEVQVTSGKESLLPAPDSPR